MEEHDTENGDIGYHTPARLANNMGPESINSKVKCKDIPELSDWKASIAFADDVTVVMNKLSFF